MIETIIDKICYTDLLFDRVNKKLGTQLSPEEIKKWVQLTLHRNDCIVTHQGKNYYVTCPSQQVSLTVNASNYRLITVDRI